MLGTQETMGLVRALASESDSSCSPLDSYTLAVEMQDQAGTKPQCSLPPTPLELQAAVASAAAGAAVGSYSDIRAEAVGAVLKQMGTVLDAAYSEQGRPSIPRE